MHDLGESPYVSVCHTISDMTSPSICQLHDSSVCQPNSHSTWNSIHPSVCLSSIPSVQPSPKFTVKIPMGIAKSNSWGNSLLSMYHWIHLLSHQAVHPSLHSCQLKPHQISLVIMGRKCSTLPA